MSNKNEKKPIKTEMIGIVVMFASIVLYLIQYFAFKVANISLFAVTSITYVTIYALKYKEEKETKFLGMAIVFGLIALVIVLIPFFNK